MVDIDAGHLAILPVLQPKADLFIGRATLSLKNVVLGKHSILTLPLETQEGQTQPGPVDKCRY